MSSSVRSLDRECNCTVRLLDDSEYTCTIQVSGDRRVPMSVHLVGGQMKCRPSAPLDHVLGKPLVLTDTESVLQTPLDYAAGSGLKVL